MHFRESPSESALRLELRSYYDNLLTEEIRTKLGKEGEGGEIWRKVVKTIGADGWLGLSWPKEYGGGGKTASEQFIFFDETRRAGAPFPFVTINTVGPTIMRFGTQEQKQFYLPKILSGELIFAIGYTEPDAGTDLGSLSTTGVRVGETYVVNGSKVFTSGADMADFIWLAVRTDPLAPKHKGISILCVPTNSPGFTWTIINTVGGLTTTATYYRDVHVPVHNRVGEENEGWRMITTQLNHERVGLAAWSGLVQQLFDDVIAWARCETTLGGGLMIDVPWVRIELARCRAEIEAMRLLNWKMVASLETDTLLPHESSSVKVFGTETMVEVCRILLGVIGTAAYVKAGSPGEFLRGRLEAAGRQAQINTFGGGVNEIQREIVATLGLGMKRSSR